MAMKRDPKRDPRHYPRTVRACWRLLRKLYEENASLDMNNGVMLDSVKELPELRIDHENAKSQIQRLNNHLETARTKAAAAEKAAEEARREHNDLKQRLYESELTCTRLRGYLDRVREDDVVREELVTTGEPGGEQTLMPKRPLPKPREYFSERDPYSDFGGNRDSIHHGERARKRRHWITYGA